MILTVVVTYPMSHASHKLRESHSKNTCLNSSNALPRKKVSSAGVDNMPPKLNCFRFYALNSLYPIRDKLYKNYCYKWFHIPVFTDKHP